MKSPSTATAPPLGNTTTWSRAMRETPTRHEQSRGCGFPTIVGSGRMMVHTAVSCLKNLPQSLLARQEQAQTLARTSHHHGDQRKRGSRSAGGGEGEHQPRRAGKDTSLHLSPLPPRSAREGEATRHPRCHATPPRHHDRPAEACQHITSAPQGGHHTSDLFGCGTNHAMACFHRRSTATAKATLSSRSGRSHPGAPPPKRQSIHYKHKKNRKPQLGSTASPLHRFRPASPARAASIWLALYGAL
jgi:hypothetical protein